MKKLNLLKSGNIKSLALCFFGLAVLFSSNYVAVDEMGPAEQQNNDSGYGMGALVGAGAGAGVVGAGVGFFVNSMMSKTKSDGDNITLKDDKKQFQGIDISDEQGNKIETPLIVSLLNEEKLQSALNAKYHIGKDGKLVEAAFEENNKDMKPLKIFTGAYMKSVKIVDKQSGNSSGKGK